MEDAITYPRRGPFRWAVGGFVAFAALFVFNVFAEPLWSTAIWGTLAAACGFGALHSCREVHLRSDGSIELRYLRRRVQSSAAEIYEVRYHRGDGGSEFRVRYFGGRFTIEDGRRARRLIEAFLRLNPAINLTGDTYRPDF